MADYKVLVNTSTILQGGGLQVATAFIQHALADPVAGSWEFMVSAPVARELNAFGIDTKADRFHVFESSPARDGMARDRVRAIEKRYGPDLVFTLFGPAYVRFRARHLCGVADPWVTHSNKVAFKSLGISKASLHMLGLMAWKGFWWKTADYWWVEAPIAKDGLISRWRCRGDRIFVIPNTCGPQFDGREPVATPPGDGPLNILCLSTWYSHKNLEIIPAVADEIRKANPDLDFQFTITLPDDNPGAVAIAEEASRLGVSEHINNIGRIAVADAPTLYEKSQLCFLPSLLEVFSAVYPESLRMGVPLVTTDLRFATDVCKDAAAYFEPLNAADAARQILRLANDQDEWNRLSQRGQEVFADLPDAEQKWELQRDMIQDVAGRA